jgi:hypothetical protein
MCNINAKFEELSAKLADLSLHRHADTNSCERSDFARFTEPTVSQVASGSTPNSGVPGVSVQDIQGEFQALRDSLARIQLPSDLKLNDSRQGIRRNDHGTLNVITKCARYNETLVKLLTTIDPGTEVLQSTSDQLFVIAYAQNRFLQDEYASLIVNSQFDSNTAKLFRAM